VSSFIFFCRGLISPLGTSLVSDHIPPFDVCSKYLSVHRLDFSLINVRRIVAKTVLACTRHIAVERHVAIRIKALALTDDTPFAGNVALEIDELVDSCHECNTNLGVVMSVIWHRLNQTEKNNMHILLALHLLKNLVSHGPLTAITETLDGAGKIYELKSYSDAKSVDHNYEVQQAADHVYGLLVDLSSLFARRRRLAFSKAQQHAVVSTGQNPWSDYLVSRLPLTIDCQKLHALFRPDGISGRVFNDTAGSSAPASVAASRDYTPSIMALGRLSKSLKNSRLEMYDGDEEDRLFGATGDQYFDESVEDRYMLPVETPPVGELRSSLQSLDITEEHREGVPVDVGEHVVSADDLFSEQEQFSFPAHSFSPENGANMLESFNYAVSSSGGGSQFGSERSSSPLHNAQDAKKAIPMGSINEVMREFSFPGDIPLHNIAQENKERFDPQASYLSNTVEASESDRSHFN